MSLRKARIAAASSGEVEAAADELLARGNAVDAVIAGVFAACAMSPGVLLGPVQLLVGGAGAGMLAIDGRVRQPGFGAPRPRGFRTGDEVPDAARVGVPWLPAALSVANATMGTATFSQVCAPAVALAKGTPRAEILKKIAARGPRAMEERPIGSELLAFAGRPSGGLLTGDDLASVQPEVLRARRITLPRGATRPPRRAQGGRGRSISFTPELDEHTSIGDGLEPLVVTTLPWTHIEDDLPAPPAHELDVAQMRAVAAVDRNATFAIACWDEPIHGLLIEDIGLRAPFFAEPVRRGQTRVKPGAARPAAGAAVLVGRPAAPELALSAFGASDAYDVLAEMIESLAAEGRAEAHGDARVIAVSHARGAASAVRV